MWRITRDCLCSARIKYPRNCNSKPKQDYFREGRAIVRSRYDSSFRRKSFIIFHFRIFNITVNGKSGQIIPSKIWLFPSSLLRLKNKMNPNLKLISQGIFQNYARRGGQIRFTFIQSRLEVVTIVKILEKHKMIIVIYVFIYRFIL